MMITGTTRVLAVIGDPVAHSLSPVFQNAGIEAAGLDYVYTALPVAAGNVQSALQGMRSLGIAGMNVTIPHKQAVMEYLDEIDDDAKVLGAVNTIVNRNGKLIGYNTDVRGFVGGMTQAGFSPAGKHVVLLGAGGAARAVVRGLLQARAASITIGVRNVAKARSVAEYFSEYMPIEVLEWQSAPFEEKLSQAGLLVNATPLGMYPKVDAMPPVRWELVERDCFVYDIIYTPAETLFLRSAREHGCRTLNGEAMLVGQGAESFRLWTGTELDREIMARALRQALK